MGKKLLIVESPAKAKTIGKYLGGDFTVKSSVGHIRDLPKESGAIRIEEVGAGKWRFVPKYVVSEGKDKVVSELKAAVKSSDEVYLASDPDREGEAIAWHLKEVLSPVAAGKPFHRVTYNEITRPAVLKAVAEPRDIDMPRVDAQQARRILDRIVGYKVSPLLWKHIQCANNRSLSAGRMQSVALRLLVERQREIDAFVPETYFLMGVEARKRGAPGAFVAKLARFDGGKPEIKDRQSADNILLDLAGAELEVVDLKLQPKTRHPLPPFTTSTLQQAASSVLGFSPGKTMKLAQSLYEHGCITYMRTDSVNVSEVARAAAKDFITGSYGEEFYPARPNMFKSKADAQGAHEAIRPTDVALEPGASGLEPAELKLYDLVWRRFVASQMADAKTTVKTVVLEARKGGLMHSYSFTASATEVEFEGFLKVMKLSLKRKKADGDDEDEESDEVAALPQLAKGELLDAAKWLADEKQTKGPAHYSEASLIKALEENGVGRPSTYAATIETLKAREYAKTEKRKLVPLERGILVSDWLTKRLDSLFNVGYTAEMEAELDKVEEKGEPMDAMLSEFYAKFLRDIEGAKDPPPDSAKFDVVFGLLDQVRKWKEPKTVGKRVYDDKAFVESVRRQRDEGKPLSARQLEFLVKMATMYADQIPDAEQKMREAGIGAGASMVVQKADDALVKFCFDTMDRIGGMLKNPFLKSLREQFDRGRGLSPKQFSILAKAVGENAAALDDCDAVRGKLAEFVPGGFTGNSTDPAVPGLLKLMEGVTEWREPAKKGKRVYDDKGFVQSLAEQYANRHSLSPRQVMALRRVAVAYKDKIPGFAEKSVGLGLKDIPSSRDKSAEVVGIGADRSEGEKPKKGRGARGKRA
ncbi:MAG: type I DNA topoisomerase [Kiritimatiellae bacterium]|nr:type I DNA topoisomerase [Kiritimatiellia bacterium]